MARVISRAATGTTTPPRPSCRYDGFISYSHAADGKLAPALRRALHQFGKPLFKLRALNLFRDEASLSATPALWDSIERALEQSRFFLLMASPEAATSPWVNKEIEWWVSHRSQHSMLIIVTSGAAVWNAATGDFDYGTNTALPPALRGVFDAEPRWTDLRWARSESDLSSNNPRFRETVADIAATLHGRPKDELIGEDVQIHNRARRLRTAAIVALSALVVGFAAMAFFATMQREAAREQAAIAEARLKEAQSRLFAFEAERDRPLDPARALVRAVEAGEQQLTFDAAQVLRQILREPSVTTVLSVPEGIGSAEFSPDGSGVATGSLDGSVRVWDRRTGVVRWTAAAGHQDLVRTVSFSPDGRHLVSGSNDTTAAVWDAASGAERHRLRSNLSWVNARFDPSGRRVLLEGPDGLEIWDAASGTRSVRLPGYRLADYDVAYSRDGTRLLTVAERTAQVLDAATGARLVTLTGHSSALRDAIFSPDGRLIATASEDGSARIWDGGTGNTRFVLNAHSGWVHTVRFSPDGKRLITAGQDSMAYAWDVATGERVYAFANHNRALQHLREREGQGIWNMQLSPDGALVLTTEADGARIWELSTGRERYHLRAIQHSIRAADFSPEGARVLTRSSQISAPGDVRIWELEAGPSARVLWHESGLSQVDVSADGSRLITNGQETALVSLWATEPVARLQTYTAEQVIDHVKFSPDGMLFLTADRDGDVAVIDARAGEILAQADYRSPIRHAEFSPDGTRIAAAGDDGLIRILDARTAREIVRFDNRDNLDQVVFSPSGDRVIGSTATGAMVWDLKTGERVAVLLGFRLPAIPTSSIFASFSPAGEYLVTHSTADGVARLWDGRNYGLRSELRGHEHAWLFDASFSPDGTKVVTAGMDTTARLWAVPSGSPLHVLRGHGDQVHAVRFSPDGRWLVTCSMDATARLWNVNTGELSAILVGHEATVWDAVFTPDSRMVITASQDGTVRFHQVRGEDLLAEGRSRLPANTGR